MAPQIKPGLFEMLQAGSANTAFRYAKNEINVGDVDQSGEGDAISMAGQRIPGEIDISDIKRTLAKAHKRGSGDDGAEVKFKGLKPCDFSVITKLHTDAQWTEWKRIRPLLIDYNNPKSRNEVSIEYDLTAEAGFTKCVVHEISTKRGKNGEPRIVTISCSSIGTKKGSTHTPSKTRYVIKTAGGLVPYAPGILLTSIDRYNALPLNVRSATAVEQARIDNDVPLWWVPGEGLAGLETVK